MNEFFNTKVTQKFVKNYCFILPLLQNFSFLSQKSSFAFYSLISDEEIFIVFYARSKI